MDLQSILSEAVRREASDVLLIPGLPASYKVSGVIGREGDRLFPDALNALAGEGSVSSLTMLQMLLVSMAVAILESFLFPEGRELEPSALRVRTVWWGLLCNLGFVGGALALGWFSNVPLWGGIFLVLFLEWGLSAMWFGLHVALRRDTRSLNRKLSEYQKRGPES